MADRINITYNELDENGKLIGSRALPFHLLIIGNFSGNTARDKHEEAFRVTRRNFPIFLQNTHIRIEGYVKDFLSALPEEDAQVFFTLQCPDLGGFHPNRFIQQLDFVQAYMHFLARFEGCIGSPEIAVQDVFEPDDLPYLQALKLPETTLDGFDVVHGVAEAYERLKKQINAILYHENFMEVEFNWMNLRMLLNDTNNPDIVFSVINTDSQRMEDDLESGLDMSETELFHQIFTKELDQYGGIPYSMALNTFELKKGDHQSAQMLADIGKVASCPILCSVVPAFFDLDNEAYLANEFDFDDYKLSESFRLWREVASNNAGRFLGLFVGQVRARDPYPEGELMLLNTPFEDIPADHDAQLHGLWGVSIYLASLPFIHSFSAYKSCFGADEQEASYIRPDIYPQAQGGRLLSWTPSERVQRALANFGVMSLRYADVDGGVTPGPLYEFNANIWGNNTDMLSVEQRVNVRLPQLLFIASLTHYLRMIQRQSVAKGNVKELTLEFNAWIRRYVSDSGNESAIIRAQRPLKRATISLREVQYKTGNMMEFQLSIVPHTRFSGLEYSLNI